VQQVSAAAIGSALATALADELVALTATLADLAAALGTDIEIVRRHMGVLQTVDHISQVQLALADILRAPGSDRDRIANVPLEDLAGRLAAATHAGQAIAAHRSS
jgi:hypothetical protein